MVAVAQYWLEHPVVAREVGGSIPLSHPFIPSWLNWIEHWVSAPVVTGSNPVEGTLKFLGGNMKNSISRTNILRFSKEFKNCPTCKISRNALVYTGFETNVHFLPACFARRIRKVNKCKVL